MKRYYLSPVVGDGLSPETAFRPKLAGDGSVNYVEALGTKTSAQSWQLTATITVNAG